MERTLTLLNESGDTTIAWDESNDEKMKEIIKKKMDEGMTFFILKKRMFGLVPMKTKLKKAKDAFDERQIIVKDSDFNDLILAGTAKTYKRTSGSEIETVAVAKTADEVVKGNSVGVKARQGG